MSDFLKNAHVMMSYQQAYIVARQSNEDGQRVLTIQQRDAAVVLRKQDAEPYDGLLKHKFQAYHGANTSSALIADAEQTYDMTIDQFRRTMRTVGCGANLILRLTDGDYMAMVERSGKAPPGVLNIGSWSRAAGGVNGPIDWATMNEFLNECNIFVRTESGRVQSLDIVPSGLNVLPREIEKILREKHERARAILRKNSFAQSVPAVEDIRYDVQPLGAIPNLTEDVIERIGSEEHVLRDRVVADQPDKGDLSGVDIIVCVRLPNVSSQDVFVLDGETDGNGQLLNRQWKIFTQAELTKAQSTNSMKFSPAPGRVISHWQQDIDPVIQSLEL